MTSAAVATLKIPQAVLDAAQMNVHDMRRELALTRLHYDAADLQEEIQTLHERSRLA